MAEDALGEALHATGLTGRHAPALALIRESRRIMLEAVAGLMEAVDVSTREGWRVLIVAAAEAGIADDDLMSEVGASLGTIARWRSGEQAPRRTTRELIRPVLVGMTRARIPRGVVANDS